MIPALRLMLFFLLTPMFLLSLWYLAWAVLDYLLPQPGSPPKCDCGRVVLRDGFALLDNYDCQLHSVDVCMPEREVIW